jgi:hypothetical protein
MPKTGSLFIRILPIGLSLVVLGAHFLRDGNVVLLLCAMLAIGALFLRKPWVVPAVQIFLILGGMVWIKTLVTLAYQRQAVSEPMLRMVLILGGVALFTVSSALLLRGRAAREWYRVEETA